MNQSNEPRNCPFCLNPVEAAEEKIRCPKCGVTHHAECWKANGRCSVYGCDGWAAWSNSIADRIAPNAEDAVLVDEQIEPKKPEVIRCITCGVPVGPHEVICRQCSRKSRKYWFENCSGPALVVLGVIVGGITMIVRTLLT